MKKRKHVFGILYGTYKIPLSRINNLKDYYKTIIKKDIIDVDIKLIKNIIEEVDWAIENPNYDFNSILETDYSNKMLYDWFKIYKQNLLFIIDKFNQGQYVITADDIPDDYGIDLL